MGCCGKSKYSKKKHHGGCGCCDYECKKDCGLKPNDTHHVKEEITGCETWRRGRKYLITGPIHVRAGATLYIEDGVTVYLQDGIVLGVPEGDIPAAALIFDAGSRLCAGSFLVEGRTLVGDCLVPSTSPQNGGLVFCGSNADLEYLNEFSGVFSSVNALPARFSAKHIDAVALGDPERFFPGVGVLGVAPHEWRIAKLSVETVFVAGLAVYGSNIALYDLGVKAICAEGAIALMENSSVTICKRIELNNRPGPLMSLLNASLNVRCGACLVFNGGVLGPLGQVQFVAKDSRLPAAETAPYQACLCLNTDTVITGLPLVV